jgi:uncharacterized protein YdeI (BOF family)
MADETLKQQRTPQDGDPQYEETTAPQNPPYSMVRPGARSGWLASSFGTLLIIFLAVVAVFTWVTVQRSLGKGGKVPDSAAVGTTGQGTARDNLPGGFDPAPEHSSTKEELEYRGAGEPPQGPMPGLTVGKISDLRAASPGGRVTLTNVTVDRADGDKFWIRDSAGTAVVTTSGDSPTVKAGQRVRIAGTVEGTGDDVHIKASRIDVIAN